MRGLLARLGSRNVDPGKSPLSGKARNDLGYLFIVTYGRSGSTLLQGIMNSNPGYLIRGENNSAVYALHRFHKLAQGGRQEHQRPQPLTSRHPFFGIDGYPSELAIKQLRALALDTILRPEPDTRVAGFKEIRWDKPDLDLYIAFLQQVFPGCRFIINTRDHDEVLRSKWWAKRADGPQLLRKREARLLRLTEWLGEDSIHVHYNDYVSAPERLRPVFTWLGEPFDLDAVKQTLAQRHSY